MTRIRSTPTLVILACLGIVLGLAGCVASHPGAADDSGGLTPEWAEVRAHALMAQDPPDWTGARDAFLVAAEGGSTTAMSYLGWMYEEGHGVSVDGREAARWYGAAAEAGAHDMAVKLGWMYLAGEGVERDRAQSEQWFGRAIAAGHSPGRIALASVLIADAVGGRAPERVNEARALLEDALQDGYDLASFFLARLYIEGVGGHPVDDERAAHYTRIGAESGNAQMQGWLALMYFEGRGVPMDPVASLKWASLAASGGDNLGDQVRRALEDNLAPEQVELARRQAVEWALQRR